jgi:hypothetical protein
MEKERDLFQWISKIIETCNQDFHFEGVDNLIKLYDEKVKDKDKTIQLEILRTRKWNEIHFLLT